MGTHARDRLGERQEDVGGCVYSGDGDTFNMPAGGIDPATFLQAP